MSIEAELFTACILKFSLRYMMFILLLMVIVMALSYYLKQKKIHILDSTLRNNRILWMYFYRRNHTYNVLNNSYKVTISVSSSWDSRWCCYRFLVTLSDLASLPLGANTVTYGIVYSCKNGSKFKRLIVWFEFLMITFYRFYGNCKFNSF